MTCAHVVDVALKKVAGVETVDVSLNKGLATVKLKPRNTVSVRQLWKLIHDNGYTPKVTTVLVHGSLLSARGEPELQIPETQETIALSKDPNSPAAYNDAVKRIGQTVTIEGKMIPAKDLKTPAPLQVSRLQ